jgi:hypothetical protein
MNLRVGYAVLVAGMAIAAFAVGCSNNSTSSTPTPTPTASGTIAPDTMWLQDATTRTVRVYKGVSTASGALIAFAALPTNDTANPDVVYDPATDSLWYPNQTVPNPSNNPGSIDIWTLASTRNNMLANIVISSVANTSNLEGAAVFTGPGVAPNLLLVAHNTNNTIDVYSGATSMSMASVPAGHITLNMTDGTVLGTPRPQEMLYDPVHDILFVADNGSVCAKFTSFSTAANAAAGGGSPAISSATQISGLGLGNGAGLAYNSVQDILFITEVNPPEINIIKTASTFNGATTHVQTLTGFSQPKGLGYDGVRDILFVYDSDVFVFPNATTASGNQLVWPNRRVVFDAGTSLSGFGIYIDTTH